jgi:putative redox protein
MPETSTVLATFEDPAEGTRINATTGSGFTLTLDSAAAGTSRGGPGPTESILAALAGCTSMDVASILRKKRQPATSYQIAVSGERSDEHPRVFTRIVVEHRVAGDVDPEALRRSIELSATSYCPVNAMLSRGVTVEHRYRLVHEERDDVSALVVTTGPQGPQLP